MDGIKDFPQKIYYPTDNRSGIKEEQKLATIQGFLDVTRN